MDIMSRILVVDRANDLHNTLKKELIPANNNLNEIETSIFNIYNKPGVTGNKVYITFSIDDAYCNQDALTMVTKAADTNMPYALIFIDETLLAGPKGIEIIAQIQRQSPDIEIIIYTSFNDCCWDQLNLHLESPDHLLFLKKPFNNLEIKQIVLSLVKKWILRNNINSIIQNLENKVKKRIGDLNDLLSELKETNETLMQKNIALAELAQKDSLTRLLNHTAFHERLDAILNEARRHNFPITLAMIDIDYFKQLNDGFGHQTGDKVLIKVADILQHGLQDYGKKSRENNTEYIHGVLRRYDIAGRYGGDEFIILFPYCGEKEANTVSNRILNSIRNIKINGISNLNITASIGVSVLEKNIFCQDHGSLVKHADSSLYKAKENGRNQIWIQNYE